MSLFIDKHNRRKSPFALTVFGAALLDFCVFALLYALLAEPLYHTVAFANPVLTVAVQGFIIAAVGTALISLLFLLRDKRIVPWGFAGLGVVFGMFCAAALLLKPSARGGMLQLIFAYGLLPVLVGNAVTWPVYRKLRRANPVPAHRKTIRQELLEAVAEESAKQKRENPCQEEPAQDAAKETEVVPSPEEALFGPEAGGGPGAFRTAEEEAMLLYMDDDDDDEESDD